MKVIIIKNTKGLGEKGEIKEVAEGYARNYLLPHKIAMAATEKEIKRIENEEKKRVIKEEKNLIKSQKLAARIESMELKIKGKANDDGTLYAQVNAAKICNELVKRGIKAEASWIQLAVPIKELGEYHVAVSLPHGLEAKLALIIDGK